MKLDSSIAAVVTGGASGLGEATVRALAELGVKVAIFDLNADLGERLAGLVGGVYCNVDVTSDAAVDRGFERARAELGQERILVNCAGAGTGKAMKIASRDRETGESRHLPVEVFDRVIQVNLVGTFRCIAKSAKAMLDLEPLEDGERGVILSTSSVAAEDGQMGQVAYAASKAGIVGMTLPMARDLMDNGIRVNVILPGTFDTPLLKARPEGVRAALAAAVPFPKRMGHPQEFASLAIEMIGNGYFNGAKVRLDGAIRMPPR